MFDIEMVAANEDERPTRRTSRVETVQQALTTAGLMARNVTGARLLVQQTARETADSIHIVYWLNDEIVAFANIGETQADDPADGPPF